ncbi:MAG: hypothetical protein NTY42_15135 [Planctomycetota bacterium]|nr:hypothetical protein [Planctomycetota bacterium]
METNEEMIGASRREFVRLGAFGIAGLVVGGAERSARGAPAESLFSGVSECCRRLAILGWRDLLLDATGGQFDLLAKDLESELIKPLSKIDRTCPGFGDFALRGTKAIEPGYPDQSLLYHALAAPSVVAMRNGTKLAGFPTLAEIETVENYIYASRKATLEELRKGIATDDLSIVVFALHYRNAPMSVNGRHAELCFSRTGIAHLGTIEPFYNPELRTFASIDEARPYDFRVTPRRFATYLAKRVTGYSGKFGLQDPQEGDSNREFWVPVHKLFSGKECIANMDLDIQLSSGMRNDVIASFHRTMQGQGLTTGWTGHDLEQYPFVVKDEAIASLSQQEDHGEGVVMPKPAALIREAKYKGKLLTFPWHNSLSRNSKNIQVSSYFVMPNAAAPIAPGYYLDTDQDSPRNAPEYINIRHRVVDEKVESLNPRPDLMELVRQGGYDVLHYTDSAGDGWVAANCRQLQDQGVIKSHAAFVLVGLPDFFPKINQRDLMRWWKNEVPQRLRATLWTVPPLALSHARIAANVELPIGFSLTDDTVTAIVAQLSAPGVDQAAQTAQVPNGPLNFEKVGLPDGSPGLFDPGWDVSIGVRSTNGGNNIHKYLVGHGLGSPFIEDAKLCAALGAYWPGLAPDATRQYPPEKWLDGLSYPWPSIVPLTDQELGMVPTATGKRMSWDGVPGPQRRTAGNRDVIAYHKMEHVDYIDILGTMTAALTAQTEPEDYKSRILAMAAVYWSLGIQDGDMLLPNNYAALMRKKSEWAVLSFKLVAANNAVFRTAAAATQHKFDGSYIYYFEIFRWGRESEDPADPKISLVEILEEVIAFSDGKSVIKKVGNVWESDVSIPT